MEIRNIERAKELIPQLEALRKAKKMMAEADVSVVVRCAAGDSPLPGCVRMNVLNVVNCEYERIRKEVEGL